ncbi:MAG: divalent-cation tolerance protein CutA [Amoebophilaceae bacterium]|nr:divalent-cation tolerance protein CutA [Amoebophilaceae bacterium]
MAKISGLLSIFLYVKDIEWDAGCHKSNNLNMNAKETMKSCLKSSTINQVKSTMIYIFWTCSDNIEAKKVSKSLLSQRLIACANIFPIASVYRWKDNIEEGKEVKVILKTQSKHFNAIQHYIKNNCNYAIPEISQVDIVHGNSDYVSWLINETEIPNLSYSNYPLREVIYDIPHE